MKALWFSGVDLNPSLARMLRSVKGTVESLQSTQTLGTHVTQVSKSGTGLNQAPLTHAGAWYFASLLSLFIAEILYRSA